MERIIAAHSVSGRASASVAGLGPRVRRAVRLGRYTLAQEFAVFDQWFCSSPTPTNPNREFLMSGTSAGVVTNDIPYGGFKQQTHYDFLQVRRAIAQFLLSVERVLGAGAQCHVENLLQ